MLRMRDHVSAGLFRCDVLFLQGINTMVFVILLQEQLKVKFVKALVI